MRLTHLSLLIPLLAGPAQNPTPAGPAADTVSPPGSPVAYRVLDDKTENNTVEYHVLLPDGTKHDEVDNLLKFLYRHVSTRREDEPAQVFAYVYATEAAYRTPPRTPIAEAVRKSGEVAPTFQNKVPLEFWQEVDIASHPKREGETEEQWKKRRAEEDKVKLKLKVERDDAQKTATLTLPYTELGQDRYAESLSFNQAMNHFTDVAQEMFEEVPDLKQLNFFGVWQPPCPKGKNPGEPGCEPRNVVEISLTRADYVSAKLGEIDERIGQHHGRAFLELSTGHSDDKKAAKDNAALIAKDYRALLTQLKGKSKVDPVLK